ncbi:MAG TPA: 3'(2'),5'-bisphosphate nucleotidase CysQ [Hyphomicrobiales bacterium]|nr:3'(2'),5'-bisphosphate nucleotidase CysQ [Hyphomicrobiales bacterium]
MISDIASAALAAGRAILDIERSGFHIAEKGDRSPVTEADARAEEIILARLRALAPHIEIISEEDSASGLPKSAPQRFFLVDPLDGTREFIAGNGEYTVNIALIENGRPVLGAVLAPASGLLFVGDGARGAFEASAPDADAEAASRARWRPISARPPRRDGLCALASRSHRDIGTENYLREIAATEITCIGSSLKFCWLASGKADLYPRFGPTMEWDTAAGQAVLEAAGGAVLNIDDTPLRYGKAGQGFRNPPFIARGKPPAAGG